MTDKGAGGKKTAADREEYLFNDVTERDMDLLLLEEFVCSEEFTRIFTDAVGIKDPKVVSTQLSKTDPQLGESDMTVVVRSGSEKIGLLIENKIDAIAMPDQSGRYVLRGEKGTECGDYDRFFVFITAPRKYLERDTEALKYPNKVEYERILSYFERSDGPRAAFKAKQLRQAIDSGKKGYQVVISIPVTEFWFKYSDFQRENYPGVFLIYNREIKGNNATWPRFRTVIDGLYMYHKSEFGFIDLTFEGCADRIPEIERLLAEAAGDYLKKGFTVHRTGKSAAVRLTVPVLDFHQPFETQTESVRVCFEAIRLASDTAKLFSFDKVYELIGNY